MADNDVPGAWPIWAVGTRLAGFMKGITKHCYKQNIKTLGLMVSEKIVYVFPHYNPMGAICCHGNQSSDRPWPET